MKQREDVKVQLTLSTFWSCPAIFADFTADRITVEMAKEVIPGTAELVALWPVIVGVTAETQSVF